LHFGDGSAKKTLKSETAMPETNPKTLGATEEVHLPAESHRISLTEAQKNACHRYH